MKKVVARKARKNIDRILKEIVITRKEGARGDSLTTLFKMRYGKDWRSAM